MQPAGWSLLVLLIAILNGGIHGNTADFIRSSMRNDTVIRGGHVELSLDSFSPSNPSFLFCKVTNQDGQETNLVAMVGKESKLQVSPNTSLTSRVTVQNNFTVVLSNISFREEGWRFKFELFIIRGIEFQVVRGPSHVIKSVQEPPSVHGKQLMPYYHGHEGSALVLNCTFIGRPLLDKVWTGALATLGKTEVIDTPSGYLTVSSLLLHITKLDPSFDKLAGQCSTKNSFGFEQQMTKLNVTYSPKNTTFVSLNPSPNEGENITVTCSAKGNPATANYRIYHQMTLVANTASGNYTFTSKNCSAESGRYKCVPANFYGNGSVAELEISIYGSPRAMVSSKLVTIRENQNFSIVCSPMGCPTPNISWYRRGTPDALTNSSVLELNNAKIGDEGNYSCRAFNQKESDSVFVEVVVHYAPQNTSLVAIPSHPVEGDMVLLSCKSNAKPTIQVYSFLRNSIQIHSSPNATFQFLTTNCKIDTANYTCIPKNAIGEDSTDHIFVSVYGPPKVVPRDSRVQIFEYENVTLSCTATGCPDPNITWYRQGSSVPMAFGSELRLVHVKAEEAGVYECVGSNARENRTVNINLAVKYPPRESKFVVVTRNLSEGNNITLRCSTKSYPPVSNYEIYRGSVLVQNTSNAQYTFLSKNCKAESGGYKCIAVNELGRDGANLTLDVYGSPKAQVLDSAARVAVNESKNVTLTCTATGCPTPTITWHKYGMGRVLSRTSLLQLTFVRLGDAGTYLCVASNDRENHSASAEVTVHFSPRNLTIESNAEQGYLQEGHDLKIQCRADAYPRARYVFYKDGKTINISDSGALVILNTQCQIHSALYSCQAFNSLGTTEQKKTNISVEGVPRITKVPQSVTVKEKENVEILCKTAGCPEPTITWKNETAVLATGDKLRFTSIESSQSGPYWCLATNKRGSTNATFSIIVQYSPRGTDLKGPKTVLAGSKVQLSCSAQGVPAVKYKFERRSKDSGTTEVLSSNSKESGVLVIDKIDYDSSYNTIFKCTPSNLLGEGPTKEVNVGIEVAPLNLTIAPNEGTTYQEIATPLNLSCTVKAANPEAQMQWFKDGKDMLFNGSHIHIPSLRKSDSGLYRCSASNKHGSASKNVSVNVTYPPEIALGIEKEFNKCIDTSISLQCYGIGNPKPLASIYYGGKTLISQWWKVSYTLTVTNEKYGDYECELKNIHGTVKEKIKVRKQVFPGLPRNVEIKPVENTLVMSWSTPRCVGQAGVASYLIYYRGKSDNDEKKQPVTCNSSPCSYTLRDLEEETFYEVAIVAVDNNGKEGSKQLVQGMKTKAAKGSEKSSKLSGQTITFISIGAVVVFLLAIALILIVRRRGKGSDVEDNKGEPSKQGNSGKPESKTCLKFDNAAYDRGQGKEDEKNEGEKFSSNGNHVTAAADNLGCQVDEDEQAGNLPLEENESSKLEGGVDSTANEAEEKKEKNGDKVTPKKENIYESVTPL